MNDSGSQVKGSKCYEQFKDLDDMNDSMWWGQGSRCYEQFRVVDDMNDLGSHEVRYLDAMSNLGLRVIWTILGRGEGSKCYEQLRVVDDMNDLRSWA